MAIAFDASSAGSSTASGATISWSHTCSGTDRILIVGFFYASSLSVSSITYNGVAMTLLRQYTSGFGDKNDVYYLLAPATGANTVSITLSGGSAWAGSSVSYTGVKQSGVPDAQTNSSQASAQTFAASLTTIAANCWTIAYTECGGGNLGAGASTTLRVRNTTYTGAGFLDSNAAVAAGSNTLNGTYSTGFNSDAYWTMFSLEPAPDPKLPLPQNINQAVSRASFY